MKYRGAHVSVHEKKRLNRRAGELLRDAGLVVDDGKDYDWIKNSGGTGYANFYLVECWNESKMVKEAIYRQLVDIDTALGTTAGSQLYSCLGWTTRWDIIKVLYFISTVTTRYILDDRF